jgi:hypothetical protein
MFPPDRLKRRQTTKIFLLPDSEIEPGGLVSRVLDARWIGASEVPRRALAPAPGFKLSIPRERAEGRNIRRGCGMVTLGKHIRPPKPRDRDRWAGLPHYPPVAIETWFCSVPT